VDMNARRTPLLTIPQTVGQHNNFTMKHFVLFLFLFWNCELSFGKQLNVAGFYVNNIGDTIDCRYKLPLFRDMDDNLLIDYSILQRKVTAIISDGSKVRLKPQDILSYSFYNEYTQYNLISVKDNLRLSRYLKRDPRLFLKLECNGYLKLFSYYKKWHSPSVFINSPIHIDVLTSKYCIKKGDSDLVKLRRSNFKKELENYLIDCSALQDKISNKYKSLNLYGFVNEYNRCIEK
jgi:hypothetical protein